MIYNFELNIYIGSVDRSANETAFLTADRESNCLSLAYELALAFQVLILK